MIGFLQAILYMKKVQLKFHFLEFSRRVFPEGPITSPMGASDALPNQLARERYSTLS